MTHKTNIAETDSVRTHSVTTAVRWAAPGVDGVIARSICPSRGADALSVEADTMTRTAIWTLGRDTAVITSVSLDASALAVLAYTTTSAIVDTDSRSNSHYLTAVSSSISLSAEALALPADTPMLAVVRARCLFFTGKTAPSSGTNTFAVVANTVAVAILGATSDRQDLITVTSGVARVALACSVRLTDTTATAREGTARAGVVVTALLAKVARDTVAVTVHTGAMKVAVRGARIDIIWRDSGVDGAIGSPIANRAQTATIQADTVQGAISGARDLTVQPRMANCAETLARFPIKDSVITALGVTGHLDFEQNH